MVERLPRPDADLLALSPWEDARLFADAKHCVSFDATFDQNEIALGLIHNPGDRPKDTARTNARAFQLFLTLAERGLPISINSVHALRRVLDLDKPLSKRSEAYHAAFSEALGAGSLTTIAAAVGVSPRTLDAIRAADGFRDEVVATVADLASTEGPLFGRRHYAHDWAVDEDAVAILAQKVISHVRSAEAISVADRLMVFDLIDLRRWRGAAPPEALLAALAYVTGVVSPMTGEPTTRALGVLWGTRNPAKFRRWAREDAESKATTGKLVLRGEWFERDRTATNFRASGAYKSIAAQRLAELAVAP